MDKQHILKNLHSLIRNSTLTYMNEFVWQDIELTEEFKNLYRDYLEENKSDVEFFDNTAIITSSSTKYIFVPNQWFVIASYAVDVCVELLRYKEYFKKVAERLYIKPDTLAKQLRDEIGKVNQEDFLASARGVFGTFCDDQEMVEEAVNRLWRFVTDYSWWSGQKTIDRGDFFVSVSLNMLNLVNTSQGYVADIVYAYATEPKLRSLVKDVYAFTVNMDDESGEKSRDYVIPDEEISGAGAVREPEALYEAIPKPERVKIKINGKNTMKEIKYKG